MRPAIVIPALWFAWFVYWNIAAIGAKAVRRRESWGSRAAHIVPLTLAVMLLAIRPSPPPPAWAEWLYLPFLPTTAAGYWIGVAILAAGLGFSIWARISLGGNWSGTVTLKQGHELIRTGPYRFVRHPIYTGLLAGFVGSAIAIGEWRGPVAVALVLYAFLRKIRLEERWMMETFGARYAAYRAEVRALVPFVA